MATPVNNTEKELLLRALYDQELPVTYFNGRVEHLFFLKRPAREEMLLQAAQPIEGLKVKEQINLTFEYRGKAVAFQTEILKIQGLEVTCTIPDFFYKDLNRSFSRVSIPSEVHLEFTFQGDIYNLSFPKVMEYDTEDLGGFLQNTDLKDLSGLIEQMSAWIKNYANNYKLVIFKETKPSIIEEQIIAETGKALFLPSTREGFPQSDPSPRKRIITEDMFKRYLENTGIGATLVGNACARFVKAKIDNNIFSDAWIPILFHEYAIGYIHIWNDIKERPPFNSVVIDTLFQFAKVLSYSLGINGYFEKGKLKNDTFEGKVIDISASGLLFAYPVSNISSALKHKSKLTIKIITPQRSITTEAVIVRHFKDSSLSYYGCQFEKLEIEDLHYLFEFIYGIPFTDAHFVPKHA